MTPLCVGASLPRSVNEATFRDVCSKSGKWFRAKKNCFVAARGTKYSEEKYQSFQSMENTGISERHNFLPSAGDFRLI
jgi:hypothetical protein